MTPTGLKDEEEAAINISITFLAKDLNAHDWGILTSLQSEAIEQGGSNTPEKGADNRKSEHIKFNSI